MRPLLLRAAPWVVLVISLAAGMVGWLTAVRRAEAERRSLFLVEAGRIHTEIVNRLEQIEVLLRTTAALFAASQAVDQSEWRQFTASVLEHDDAGVIRGLAFIRRVPATELAAFLHTTQTQLPLDFRPRGERPEYRIIQFIEPADANRVALGFDSNTVAESRDAMDRAASTGWPAVSSQFHLVQEPSRELSVAIYAAVYDRAAASRGGPPLGWVGASLRTEALTAQLQSAQSRLIDFELFDSSLPDEDHRLKVTSVAAARDSRRLTTYALEFGGRPWLLRIYGQPPAGALEGEAGLIGCGSLVISLLLFGLVATVNSTRARATALAEKMTADLRASEARSSKWTEVLLRLTAQQACFDDDLREALGRITEAGAEALAVERVSVWACQDEPRQLTCLDQYEQTDRSHRRGATLPLASRRAYALAFEQGQLVVVDSLDQSPAAAAGATADQVSAALVVPVRLGGRTMGVIAHEHVGGARCWTLQERNFAASLAAQVSLALETRERRRTEQVLTDYTKALETANASLEESSHQVQAANQAKTEFLANMSHEIRTPLTSILGYAELVLHDEQIASSDDERQGALRVIQRNGEHLLGILNDILDLSKIEAGKLSCEQLKFSPGHLLHEVATLMGVRAQAKGLTFVVACDGPIPRTIRSDPTRLRQILINLLGNAVKFTDTGEVRITVRLAADAAELLEFEVRDTGVGMNAAQLEKVFQPFAQADSSTTRQFGGTGLGLAISSRLAKMLGGRLECESQSGDGSVFRVFIATGPLDGVKRTTRLDDLVSAGQEDEEANSGPLLAGRRVLLAEDGPDNQRLVSLVLRKSGAEVTIVENGREAVDHALTAYDAGRPFDVVLMDMQMPVLDGYSATEQLREAGYALPIVALTAHAMVGDREKCLAAGCTDYATKPIDRRALIALLVDLLAADLRHESTDA